MADTNYPDNGTSTQAGGINCELATIHAKGDEIPDLTDQSNETLDVSLPSQSALSEALCRRFELAPIPVLEQADRGAQRAMELHDRFHEGIPRIPDVLRGLTVDVELQSRMAAALGCPRLAQISQTRMEILRWQEIVPVTMVEMSETAMIAESIMHRSLIREAAEITRYSVLEAAAAACETRTEALMEIIRAADERFPVIDFDREMKWASMWAPDGSFQQSPSAAMLAASQYHDRFNQLMMGMSGDSLAINSERLAESLRVSMMDLDSLMALRSDASVWVRPGYHHEDDRELRESTKESDDRDSRLRARPAACLRRNRGSQTGTGESTTVARLILDLAQQLDCKPEHIAQALSNGVRSQTFVSLPGLHRDEPDAQADRQQSADEAPESPLVILDEGGAFRVTYGRDSSVHGRLKGFAILKILAEHPDKEFGVIQLWALASGMIPGRESLPDQEAGELEVSDQYDASGQFAGGTMPISDKAAVDSYNERLKQIEVEMALAIKCDDLATQEKLSAEREQILACVPVDQGGKVRGRMHSEQEERARSNVGARIDTALKAIQKQSIATERHIRSRLIRGYRYRFLPISAKH